MSEAAESRHLPVLAKQVIELLDPKPGEVAVDATVGLGGHARLIADRVGPTGRVIALDQDEESLSRAKETLLGLPVTFVHANFSRTPQVLAGLQVAQIDIVLADLGVSSPQLDQAERGFSFRRDGPLDMRMDQRAGSTAADLIAQLSERDLAWIFWEYGEERFSRQVARRICELRRKQTIRTTGELAEIVRSVVPRASSHHRRGGARLDPATRVFQALRIAVNDEKSSIEQFMKSLPDFVKPGGRAAIISFHSLEDRIVKHAFKDRSVWEPVTKSPVVADEGEMSINPRSRSAKLRVARRGGSPSTHSSQRSTELGEKR